VARYLLRNDPATGPSHAPATNFVEKILDLVGGRRHDASRLRGFCSTITKGMRFVFSS
jgi:hypothetical protein